MKIFILLLLTTNFVNAEYFSIADDKASVKFIHDNGHSNDYFYPEIVGSGVALIDYDNDGDLDVYLIQSGSFENDKKADKLFKNLLIETKSLKFIDVSTDLKLDNSTYGIGVATADFNNDGWMDLYITNLAENQLLINQQGKGFKTITENQSSWSSSASFCDINNDGYKDLYVSNYVNWSATNNPKCFNPSSKQDYCGPDSFEGLKDTFYINDKGKKLIDKTSQYFPDMPALPGLNVICQDVNNDGWSDFIVANDGKANLLWLNQKGQYFKESGLFSGLAVNAQGVAEASMGMAMGDYDVDGDLDVFFTHLMNETNTLYKNNGKGYFQDVTNQAKLSSDSFAFTGWAAGFLMVNDDIYPDLVVFNGAVADSSDKSTSISKLEQVNQLYINSVQKSFSLVKGEKWLKQKHISRGAAFGDLDNDGDTDIVVNNNNDATQILLNNLNPIQWLGFQYSSDENIQVVLINDKQQYQLNTQTDGSYASAHDHRFVLNHSQIKHFDTIKFTTHSKILKSMSLSALTKNQYTTIEFK